MLVFIFCPLLLLAPVLQGVWDFRTQFRFEAAVLFTGGFWLFRETMSGRPPAFLYEKRGFPLLCALGFSFVSSRLSPVSGLIAPEWWNFLTGVFILALATTLTPAERKNADLALRAAAWFIVLLNFYQAYVVAVRYAGDPASPLPAALTCLTASLPNANTLALFAIMLIPLAVVWRDFFLLGALVIVLIGTLSIAAVIGLLAAACFYAADNVKLADFKKNWRLFAVIAVVAAAAISQLELASVSDRLLWWGSAFRMFLDRPLLGFGPGAFTYVYPAFHQPDAARLAATYVHNYYLEFLAENGLIASVFWGWAVLTRLKSIKGLKKYALIACLVHSGADFGLAVPAIFFIFCYLLSEPRSFGPVTSDLNTGRKSTVEVGGPKGLGEPRSFGPGTTDKYTGRKSIALAGDPKGLGEPSPSSPGAVRPEKKTVVALAALGLACFAALSGIFASRLKLESLHTLAQDALQRGDYSKAEAEYQEAERLAPENPRVPGLLGRIRIREGAEKKDKGRFFSAAVDLERAVLLDPYNAGAWTDLKRLYGAAGEPRLLEGLQKRKAEVFK